MRKQFTKIALAATLGLALTFTLGCKEKKSAEQVAAEAQRAAAEQAAQAQVAEEAATLAKIRAEAVEAEKAATEQAEANFSKAEKAAKKAISCKGNEKVKLLVGITDEEGKPQTKFEYDEQNRIVKIYQYSEGNVSSIETIAYSGDDLVTVEKIRGSERNVSKYVINGNTITVNDNSFTINKDGSIAKVNGSRTYTYEDGHTTENNFIPYTYQGGNLTKRGPDNSDNDVYYYDDEKSSFSNTNTPKWLLQKLLYDYSASKNNIRSMETEVCLDECPVSTFDYKYDRDGFPTIMIYEGSIIQEVYTYCGGGNAK